jgi:hypothetical protein
MIARVAENGPNNYVPSNKALNLKARITNTNIEINNHDLSVIFEAYEGRMSEERDSYNPEWGESDSLYNVLNLGVGAVHSYFGFYP